jgi:hypothetical protein
LSTLSTQLLTVRTRLAEESASATMLATRLREFTERLRVEADPQARAEFEAMQKQTVSELESARVKHTMLQAEADRLSAETSAEQSRVNDVRDRLDEIERLLGGRGR